LKDPLENYSEGDWRMARDDDESPGGRHGRTRGEPDGPVDQRRQALRVLMKARESLIAQMAEEINSNQEVILGDPSQTGIFGFEFQEIEDRFIGRLNAINSILDNLEYRRARIMNRTEVIFTTRKKIREDLDDLISRYDQWDVVDLNATKITEDQLMVIVAFTADEYAEEAGGQEAGEDREPPPGA